MAKVIFTYILGYKVDVGHMEAVNLISSQKYSEKQIVSAALSMLQPELTALVGLSSGHTPHARKLRFSASGSEFYSERFKRE